MVNPEVGVRMMVKKGFKTGDEGTMARKEKCGWYLTVQRKVQGRNQRTKVSERVVVGKRKRGRASQKEKG